MAEVLESCRHTREITRSIINNRDHFGLPEPG
jgi:hypothetical protein